jgi:hypothetical protein
MVRGKQPARSCANKKDNWGEIEIVEIALMLEPI